MPEKFFLRNYEFDNREKCDSGQKLNPNAEMANLDLCSSCTFLLCLNLLF